jgi:hypothetical protein
VLFEISCIASMSRVDVIRLSSGVIFSSTRRTLSENGTWLMIVADRAVRSSLSLSSSVRPSLARFLASASNYYCGKFRQGIMAISSSEISTGSAATAGGLPRGLSLVRGPELLCVGRPLYMRSARLRGVKKLGLAQRTSKTGRPFDDGQSLLLCGRNFACRLAELPCLSCSVLYKVASRVAPCGFLFLEFCLTLATA